LKERIIEKYQSRSPYNVKLLLTISSIKQLPYESSGYKSVNYLKLPNFYPPRATE